MRTCRACGTPIAEGRRSTAKFCDSNCRTRYTRGHRPGPGGDVVPIDANAADDQGNDLLTLEDVARELQRALVSPSTPASSKAGLSKELRAVRAEMARDKPATVSLIDQLAERRAQRTGS